MKQFLREKPENAKILIHGKIKFEKLGVLTKSKKKSNFLNFNLSC